MDGNQAFLDKVKQGLEQSDQKVNVDGIDQVATDDIQSQVSISKLKPIEQLDAQFHGVRREKDPADRWAATRKVSDISGVSDRSRATSAEGKESDEEIPEEVGEVDVKEKAANRISLKDSLAEVATYREWLDEQEEVLGPYFDNELIFKVAAGVVNDAWSRRWFNIQRLQDKWARRSSRILQNPFFKTILKLVILLHMSLVFFEPAGTFHTCGVYYAYYITLLVEASCVAFYLFVTLLYHSAGMFALFELRRKGNRGRKTYPVITLVITLLTIFDVAIGFYMFRTTGRHTLSFSRPFRGLLLISNTRPLRDMFSTIVRVMPSAFGLMIFCLVIILCYSIIGFHLFYGVYPPSESLELFNSWESAFTLLFVLFTTENYPKVMLPALEISPIFMLYFIPFLFIGGAMFTVVLGVVYDVYKQSVVKTAFKNFGKERLGLTVAFALVQECQKGRGCHRFPCEHGEGILDEATWFSVFKAFKTLPYSSYVAKVYKRNMKGFKEDQIRQVSNDLFQAAVDPEFRENELKETIMKPGAHKRSKSRNAILARQRTTAQAPNPGGIFLDKLKIQTLDILGFFRLCDRIRSRSEVALDRSLIIAKQSWLQVLQCISDEQQLGTVEKWQKRRPSLTRKIARLKRLHEKPIEAAKMKDSDIMLEVFQKEVSELESKDRLAIRNVMMENIGYLSDTFPDQFDATKLLQISQTSFMERLISSKAYKIFIELVIIVHVLCFVILGRSVTESLYHQAFLYIYLLEIISSLSVLKFSYFKESWNRFNLFLISISWFGTISLHFPYSQQYEAILRACSSLIIFRSIWVAVAFFENPENARKNSEAFLRYLSLKNMVFNVTRIGALILWVIMVIFYFFAVFGMELFGCSPKNASSSFNDPYDTTNFDSMLGSVMSLFQLSSSNNWQYIMYAAVSATSFFAVPFFLIFYFIMLVVIVNLFAALVVEALDTVNAGSGKSDAEKHLGNENTFDLFTRFLA